MLITTYEKAKGIAEKANVLLYCIDPAMSDEMKAAGVLNAAVVAPENDLIQKVVKGELKMKAAVKKHVKRVSKMKAGDEATLSMVTLLRIVNMKKSRKTPLLILVSDDDTEVGKFVRAAVKKAFEKVFGITILTTKDLKKSKALKGKKKQRKAKVAELALKASAMSSKGKEFYKEATKFYFPENLYTEVILGHAGDHAAMDEAMRRMRLKGKNSDGKKNDSMLILMEIIKGDKKVRKIYEKFRKESDLLAAVGVELPKIKKLKKIKVQAMMFFLCHLVATRKDISIANAKDYRVMFQAFLGAVDKATGSDTWAQFKKVVGAQ